MRTALADPRPQWHSAFREIRLYVAALGTRLGVEDGTHLIGVAKTKDRLHNRMWDPCDVFISGFPVAHSPRAEMVPFGEPECVAVSRADEGGTAC